MTKMDNNKKITFSGAGHKNILALHKNTLEFTKDSHLTLNGDCIVCVNCNFDTKAINELFKDANQIKISITSDSITDEIIAEYNPGFNSEHEMVIRISGFTCPRTLAIRANKAAKDIDRRIIEKLKQEKNLEILMEKLPE